MEKLNNYILSPAALSMIAGSSQGTQIKYYDNGYWYKKNQIGYEDVAEYLASIVLSCSNISNYVTYERCLINNKNGCRSKNFLQEGESYISLQRLHDLYIGGDVSDVIYKYDNIDARIKYVVDFVKEVTSLDLSNYLSKMLSFDALILNTDRHFHNIGVISNSITNAYTEAPVFDNGNSMLSNLIDFPYDTSIEDNIENIIGKPFASNLEYQAFAFSFGLKIDYEKLYVILSKQPSSRALDVLFKQLEKYKKIYMFDSAEVLLERETMVKGCKCKNNSQSI